MVWWVELSSWGIDRSVTWWLQITYITGAHIIWFGTMFPLSHTAEASDVKVAEEPAKDVKEVPEKVWRGHMANKVVLEHDFKLRLRVTFAVEPKLLLLK